MARQTSCRIFSIILNSSYDSLGPQKLKKTEIVDYEVLKGGYQIGNTYDHFQLLRQGAPQFHRNNLNQVTFTGKTVNKNWGPKMSCQAINIKYSKEDYKIGQCVW